MCKGKTFSTAENVAVHISRLERCWNQFAKEIRDVPVMSTYVPIDVALVTCRLTGTKPSPHMHLAKLFPCQECGAPAGMACLETGKLCWRSRLLSDEHWKAIASARKNGRGAPGGWLDEVWTGMNRMQMRNDGPAAQALRWMSKENQKIVKEVLDVMSASKL